VAECTLRKALPQELPICMEILASGREFQRAQGFVQWADGYPDSATVERDLLSGDGWFLCVDGEPAGYFYLGFTEDPSYPLIKGAWRYDGAYAVVHRIAIGSAYRGQGLTGETFRLIGELALSRGVEILRIDTLEENLRMRHVVEKNGFAYCGTVIQSGGDRMAFDKKLN
jgi:RimJ/RimL family protein N-acetyltransferase